MRRVGLRLGLVLFLSVGFYFYTHTIALNSTSNFFSALSYYINYTFSYGTSCCLWISSKVTQPFKHYHARYFLYRDIYDNLDSLRQEREDLIAQVIELSESAQVYKEIKELVTYKERYNHKSGIIAQVLVKQFLPDSHFFLIDAGNNDGIKTDMIVIYKNNLIGRVSEVFSSYSRVDLITDKRCKIAAKTSKFAHKGIHEGLCKLDTTQVTQIYDNTLKLENEVQVGELIVSSGEGLVFPRGFALGKIKNITRNDFQCTLELEPLIAIDTINYCLVLSLDSCKNSNKKV